MNQTQMSSYLRHSLRKKILSGGWAEQISEFHLFLCEKPLRRWTANKFPIVVARHNRNSFEDQWERRRAITGCTGRRYRHQRHGNCEDQTGAAAWSSASQIGRGGVPRSQPGSDFAPPPDHGVAR
jgi:hypothetical protein